MYDYMKALQKRFDRQEHSELDAQIKSAHEELRRDMDAAGRKKLLRLLDAQNTLLVESKLMSFTAGFKLAWGMAKELEATALFLRAGGRRTHLPSGGTGGLMAKRRPAGDGWVRKREDGRWEGRIVVGHKKNGTPIFQHAYAHTQKELTEKLHQNIERYQDVELTEDSRMTLGEWLDRWLTDYKENTVRPGTLAGYRSCIENYIKPQLGGKQVSLVTSQDVQKLYRRLKENGRVREPPRFGSALSDTTINRLHAIFHQAMEDALHAHIIAKNPTVGATVPKGKPCAETCS